VLDLSGAIYEQVTDRRERVAGASSCRTTTQAVADALCNRARVALMHLPYPGQMATAANIASPFTPLEIPLGQVCAFNIYHLS
jgi:hypothetical protein